MENIFFNKVYNTQKERLNEEELKTLLYDYRYNNNENSRNLIIEDFYTDIAYYISRFVYSYSERENYISVCVMALIRAIDSYDLDSPTMFSTYARKCISNAITHESVENSRSIRIPYTEAINASKYMKEKSRLKGEFGRNLTIDELSDLLDIKASKILDYETENAEIVSLNEKINDEFEFEDVVPASYSLEEEVFELDAANDLKNKIAELEDAKERLIIKYMYGFIDGESHTQVETAKMLEEQGYGSTSRSNIQKIEKKVLQKLKTKFEEDL